MPQEPIGATFIVHTCRGKHLVINDKDKEMYNPSSCHRYIHDLVQYS